MESNTETIQKKRKQKRENLIDESIDLGRFFELASSDKIYVIGLYLHEIKSEILLEYVGDFELNGLRVKWPVEHETNIRFKNVDDFESFINAIDIDYDSNDVTFTGYVYKSNTPQFNRVNRSQYGRSTDFEQDVVEYIGNNCFIPPSGICFYQMF